MTPKTQKNIFDILAVPNKEPVHSAMLKYLIERDSSFANSLLDIAQIPAQKTYSAFLDHSGFIKHAGNRNKRLHFDIVVVENGVVASAALQNPIAIIANTYKSPPTTKQLEVYDQYLAENALSPQKILMVYTIEQVPSDVVDYCKDNWKVVPYFSYGAEPCMLDLLKQSARKVDAVKEKHLLEDYTEYLRESFQSTRDIVQSPDIKSEFDLPDNREAWASFLYYLQGETTKIFCQMAAHYDYADIETNNDGGKNKPGIAMEFESEQGYRHYLGIDGSRVKLGFYYHPMEDNEAYKESVLAKFKAHKAFTRHLNPRELKTGGAGMHAYAFASFDLFGRSWQAHDASQQTAAKIIHRTSKVFRKYYRIIKNINHASAH